MQPRRVELLIVKHNIAYWYGVSSACATFWLKTDKVRTIGDYWNCFWNATSWDLSSASSERSAATSSSRRTIRSESAASVCVVASAGERVWVRCDSDDDIADDDRDSSTSPESKCA